MAWNNVYRKMLPYIVSIDTPNGSGTGFLFAYNQNKRVAAFATAAHVVDDAHDWKQPIKVRHHATKKELFIAENQRAILLDRPRDSASILIANKDIDLPGDTLPMMDPEKFKAIGIEVAWIGYPSIATPYLCFFTGRVSAFIDDDDSYLIDGVAINGVSGGPVFAQLKDDLPQLIGTVSAYMPNRIRGDALPGLLRAQDVTAFHDTIQAMKSLDEARETEAKQDAKAAEQPPQAGQPQSSESKGGGIN